MEVKGFFFINNLRLSQVCGGKINYLWNVTPCRFVNNYR
jgi:hypothetical protein